jgi:hypothetical protein
VENEEAQRNLRSINWHGIEGRALGQGEEAAEVSPYKYCRKAMTKAERVKVDAENAKCLEPHQLQD